MKTFSTVMLAFGFGLTALAQEPGRYAVLIGGLGGSEAYTEQFREHLFQTRRALVERFGFPADQVVVLAEQAEPGGYVTDVSTAENINAQFARLAGRIGAGDQVYVVLFGHGAYDGTRARLNIPRRDLSDEDYAALVGGLGAGRVVFVHTGSASAPFIETLSGPDRIVITATRAPTQRNETVFPRFWVEGLTSPAADLDKNGDFSVRELFAYAARNTDRWFEENGQLATEHALLEDTGDGQGFREEELTANAEGNLAGVTYLMRRGAALAAVTGAERAALAPRLAEREAIERDVAALKARKPEMDEDQYYAALETLFVRLARLNDELERRP